jgi:hypothetical protein
LIIKIVSGGQTGAERAALDFAIDKDILHGGWVPKDRIAEDGTIPNHYHLTEMATKSYPKKTEQNVIDSDGTLIISHGPLSGGSMYTIEMTVMHGRLRLHIDLNRTPAFGAAQKVIGWIEENRINTLNVTGPRSSKNSKIYQAVYNLLETIYYMAIAKEDVVAMRGSGLPKTVDEAVSRLVLNMPLKAKTELAKHDESELRFLHFSFGAFIRNQFEIWSGNVELLNDCRRLSGITFMNPDDAVAFIITKLWEQLQKTHKLRVVK